MYQFDNFVKHNIEHGMLEQKFDLKVISKQTNQNQIVFPEQIHGKEIYICSGDEKGEIKGTDGLITKEKNQVLAIRTADCIPLFLYDYSKEKIGLIHAGFKGLIKGIIKEGIEKGKFNLETLLIGIGPHIRKDHYYLRGSNKKYYQKENLKKYFYKKNDKLYFSITELAIDQLVNNGVLRENIEDCRICTYCNKNFLSARKQGKNFNCFGSFIKL